MLCTDLLLPPHSLLRYQVPDEDAIKVDREDISGPAGRLRGVHRDFLLLLLYFPWKEG